MQDVPDSQISAVGPIVETTPRCPLCDARMAPWLLVPRRGSVASSREHQLYRCRDCSFGWLSPVPTWDELAPHYAWENYYTHRPVADKKKSRSSFVDRLRLHFAWRSDRGTPLTADALARLVPRGSAVCEIGCGGGLLLAQLARAGADVVGVE